MCTETLHNPYNVQEFLLQFERELSFDRLHPKWLQSGLKAWRIKVQYANGNFDILHDQINELGMNIIPVSTVVSNITL